MQNQIRNWNSVIELSAGKHEKSHLVLQPTRHSVALETLFSETWFLLKMDEEFKHFTTFESGYHKLFGKY